MKKKFYRLDFSFGDLGRIQRINISEMISQDFGVSFGKYSLCIFPIYGKKDAKLLKSKIDNYLSSCHVVHFSEITEV